MTIVEAIQEVFEGIEPNGTFAFDSEVKGDAGERYKDKAVNTPFCLISPNVNGEATIVNSQFNDRLTLRVFFLTFIDSNWKTYAEIESNIVEPMRQLGMNTLTKVLYQYPTVVTVDETTNIPHTDIYKWGSGRHAGAMFTFSVKQKRELNLCTAPITFDVVLSSGDNGTTVPEPDTYTYNKGEVAAYYAEADPGFEFSQWLVNGVANLTNPLALTINRAYTVVAQFIVSIIKQLSIAVVGNGTTDPTPGNYDVAGGSTQAITAIENDTDYIFDEFTVDGTPTTDNPVIVTVNDNTNVVAYFVIKWLQWVFSETITKIVDKYYFPDKSPNGKKVGINNTQVGNFNGSVYIAYDMTGLTITSYEGVGVPTKTNDSRIDVSAGLLYSITLSNGEKCYFNEEEEDVIFFTDGTSGTLENVVLANFWDTKSEFGTPGTVINGYSKYLINQSAGTTFTLALPDGSNVGTDIPAYGVWQYSCYITGTTLTNITFITDSSDLSICNGYRLDVTANEQIILRQYNSGSLVGLFLSPFAYVTAGNTYEFKIQRNSTIDEYVIGAVGTIACFIRGNEYAEWTLIDASGGGSNPITRSAHTTTKFFVVDNDVSDEISRITYNGQKFDLSNFIDGTGTYGVQKVLGVGGGLDAKGNDLEIPANVVSNSGNTYDGIEGLADGATYEDVYDTTFDEETKTANKVMGYVSEIKVL